MGHLFVQDSFVQARFAISYIFYHYCCFHYNNLLASGLVDDRFQATLYTIVIHCTLL